MTCLDDLYVKKKLEKFCLQLLGQNPNVSFGQMGVPHGARRWHSVRNIKPLIPLISFITFGLTSWTRENELNRLNNRTFSASRRRALNFDWSILSLQLEFLSKKSQVLLCSTIFYTESTSCAGELSLRPAPMQQRHVKRISVLYDTA